MRVAPQLGVNGLKSAFDILKNVVVPESDDTVTSSLQIRVAPFVIVLILCMLSAIELYYESALKAYEIDDEGADRSLPMKFKTFESTRAQMAP